MFLIQNQSSIKGDFQVTSTPHHKSPIQSHNDLIQPPFCPKITTHNSPRKKSHTYPLNLLPGLTPSSEIISFNLAQDTLEGVAQGHQIPFPTTVQTLSLQLKEAGLRNKIWYNPSWPGKVRVYLTLPEQWLESGAGHLKPRVNAYLEYGVSPIGKAAHEPYDGSPHAGNAPFPGLRPRGQPRPQSLTDGEAGGFPGKGRSHQSGKTKRLFRCHQGNAGAGFKPCRRTDDALKPSQAKPGRIDPWIMTRLFWYWRLKEKTEPCNGGGQ